MAHHWPRELLIWPKLKNISKQVPSGRDPRLRGKVILHVKQTMIIYKHNTPKKSYYHVYVIAHLYGSVSYNHEKVNFRMFNAYKRYKLTKVKGCLHSLDWTTGLDNWTGLLDCKLIKCEGIVLDTPTNFK